MCNCDDLLSAPEAAAMLGLTPHGLTARCRNGTLPGIRVGGITIYRRSDIEKQPPRAKGERGPKPKPR